MGEAQPGRLAGMTAAAAAGTVLAPLNSTMLAVALGPLRETFGVSTGWAAWLVTAYLIAMAVGQPIGGRLGDLYGRRRLYLGALAYFALASAACAVAWDFPSLVFFRVQQAIAAAIIVPNGTAALRVALPPAARGRAFGILGALIGIGAALGPPLGGVLLDTFGWRALFAANVPVIAVAAALALRFLPDADASFEARRAPFDAAGAALFSTGLTAVVLATTVRSDAPFAAGLLAAGLALLAAFWRQEHRAAAPLVAPGIFQVRSYAAGSVAIFCANLSMYTAMLLAPLYLHDLQGRSPSAAGAAVGLMALAQVALAPVAGVWADRSGRRLPALAGAGIFTAGLVTLPLLSVDSPLWHLAGGLTVMGAGLGLLMPSAQTAALEATPPELAGMASGTYSTVRYLGSILGTGLLGLFLSETLTDIGQFRSLLAILAAAGALTVPAAAALHTWAPTTTAAAAERR